MKIQNLKTKAASTTENILPKATSRSSSNSLAVTLFFAAAFIIIPDAAFAAGGNPVQSFLDGFISFLNTGVMRSVAILSIIGLGFLAYRRKIDVSTCLYTCAGIILTFGAASLADLGIGWAG